MLHEFLTANRDKIISRTRAKVADRPAPRATEAELRNGIPLFLTQLVEMLQLAPAKSVSSEIKASAATHGEDLRRIGLSVGQVVHDYGGLCQAITEIAAEDKVPISTSDFKILNGSLDHAIASAVSEFERQRDQSVSDENMKHLGFLAHEMRNMLNAAAVAFHVIQMGTVGTSGSTADLLTRSLDRMRELIDRSLTEVRLKAGTHKQTVMMVASLIKELTAMAELEAQQRGLQFTIEFDTVTGVAINADAHLLVSALTNLLHNAFKFTRPHSHVSLRAIATAERVRIEIEDECGGLPGGQTETLFRVFEQKGEDRSGLGLGLAISRQAVEANGGTIEVRDLPGRGCVFTVELPRHNS